MPFYKDLILFLDSTRICSYFNVQKTPYFFHIIRYCSTSFSSLSVTLFSSCLYEAPPSEKHNVL